MVIPRDLVALLDVYLDDEDHSVLDRLIRGLPGTSGRLNEPEMSVELALFFRMMYKNKCQHRGTTYYRSLTHIKAAATRLQQLEIPALLAELSSVVVPPGQGQARLPQPGTVGTGPLRRGTVAVATQGGSWRLPSRQAVLFSLSRLDAGMDLCLELCEASHSALARISVLLAQSYFLPLATMATAALARLAVLALCQAAVMSDAYNLIASAVGLFPPTIGGADWAAPSRTLPASTSVSVPSRAVERAGVLDIGPMPQPGAGPDPDYAAEGAARPGRGGKGVEEGPSCGASIRDLLPESMVPRQQKRKGVKRKHDPTAEEVREVALQSIVLIEDRKGAPSLQRPGQDRPRVAEPASAAAAAAAMDGQPSSSDLFSAKELGSDEVGRGGQTLSLQPGSSHAEPQGGSGMQPPAPGTGGGEAAAPQAPPLKRSAVAMVAVGGGKDLVGAGKLAAAAAKSAVTGPPKKAEKKSVADIFDALLSG